MAVPAAVDPVDHTGQRGGLARTRRSGDQHKPSVAVTPALRVVRKGQDILRNPKLYRIRQLEADHTDHRRKGTSLPEHIDPEAPAREIVPPGHGQ